MKIKDFSYDPIAEHYVNLPPIIKKRLDNGNKRHIL